MNPINKPTYDYLHSLLDAATKHFDECDEDILDCDCGKQIDGDVLIDLMLMEMRRLRDGEPDGVCQGGCAPADCSQCDRARDVD